MRQNLIPQFIRYSVFCLLGLCLAGLLSTGWGQILPATVYAQSASPEAEADTPNETDSLRPFAEVTDGLTRQHGVFTLYSDLDAGKAYLALQPDQLNRNFVLVATLASGLGEAGLFRGWPVNDLLVQFQELPGDRLQIVVPNVYLRNADPDPWQQRLLDSSFSDSVVAVVPVVSIDPTSEARLVDLSALLLERDLGNLSQILGGMISGYGRNPELSRVQRLQVFPENLEIATTVGFSGGGSTDPLAALFGASLQSLPDARGFVLDVHYSLSPLPEDHGYRPRLADERVGYFISAFRAPLQSRQQDPFVRYIHRWHLEKQQPEAALSAPKEPIVFWIENTVPPAYREALRAGVLMWNDAFEQAGFENAIEVRQMPDQAGWDPADVRYNVIRWSDSVRAWAFGLGPSRVNPLTGEILDADVIIDASTVSILRQQYLSRDLDSSPTAAGFLQLCGQRSQAWYLQWQVLQQQGEAGLALAQTLPETLGFHSSHHLPDDHCAGYGTTQQAAFGSLALSVLNPTEGDRLETYIQHYLTALTAHEVGHTLGLRHNFAGSRLLLPEQLHDPQVTQTQGLVSSVMDYFPPNVAPPGYSQGDFFPQRLGPYDKWAIEYGYRPAPPSPLPRTERQMLEQILTRSQAPELAYATDEDIFDFIDPEVNAWDLSTDPLQFAEWQLENARAVWQRLDRLSVNPGEGYGGLRQRVDLVFGYFRANLFILTDYIGGQRFRRLDPWDNRQRRPLEPIPADRQRAALAVLEHQVFAPEAFQFSPELLNQLPPDRWAHWGVSLTTYPLDYPIYDRVLTVQSMALSDLMLAERLARIRDLEFKASTADVLTLPELFESLYQAIWSEIAAPTEAVPTLSSLRRGLQRHHLNLLSNLVLRRTFQDALAVQDFSEFMALAATLGAPEDARSLARYQLRQIQQDVEDTLSGSGDRLAVTTRAHLEAVRDRIEHVLTASLVGA